MTTTTRPIVRTEERQHWTTTILRIGLFWLAGAVLAATARIELDAISQIGAAAVAMAAIFSMAWAYTHFSAHHRGLSHALDAGIVWLLLAIVAEIVITSRIGHGWYALLGSPQRPLLRNLFFFVWMFAPAAFARRQEIA